MSISIRVTGLEGAGEARRKAVTLASELEMDEAVTGRLAIVVTECATNLWKHAGGGEILLSPTIGETPQGVEVLALDKGPGMEDVAMCLRDGYSTAGSAGTGLGAVQRLSSECEIYSGRDKGTVLLARIYPVRNGFFKEVGGRLEVGAVSVPIAGEVVCGDGFAVHQETSFSCILAVDGLGHGPDAAVCAERAEEAFRESVSDEPAAIIGAIHTALRPLRGAAASVARFDPYRREIRYCGIGNVAGTVYANGDVKQMASLPGIVGHESRSVREFTYAWPERSTVLLYSDGIATRWSMADYDQLTVRDPALLAGVLYRDLSRGRDDATVVVARDRVSK